MFLSRNPEKDLGFKQSNDLIVHSTLTSLLGHPMNQNDHSYILTAQNCCRNLFLRAFAPFVQIGWIEIGSSFWVFCYVFNRIQKLGTYNGSLSSGLGLIWIEEFTPKATPNPPFCCAKRCPQMVHQSIIHTRYPDFNCQSCEIERDGSWYT